MPSEVGREPPCGGSRPARAKGLSVQRGRHSGHTVWTQSQAHGGNHTGRRATGITTPSRGVDERAFKPREVWEGPVGTSDGCQPDSGKPTVRDERGACGNVNHGGIRNPLHNRKGVGRKLSTYRCARRISTRLSNLMAVKDEQERQGVIVRWRLKGAWRATAT